jgi:molecular chaperone GrpE
MHPDDTVPQGTPEIAPDTDPPAPDDVPDPLAQLAAERDVLRDQLLRTTAEFDNFRKRTERERREFVDYASAELLKDILPVLDDLERAARMEGKDPSVEAYVKGIGLIARQFADLLARRGVEVIDPLGADFDPHWHEAIARESVDGARDGEVVLVLSRGYRIKDRLLRPAMVKVATA